MVLSVHHPLSLICMFIKGVEEDCPANCLSIFSLVSILLGVSTAILKSSIGKSTQYNFDERVFLNTSKIWGSC